MGGKPRWKPDEYEYVLKQVGPDMKSYGGFVWPEKGPVWAPDWDPTPDCGGGLHGWLRGEGDGLLADPFPDRRWLVLRVRKSEIVDLKGKVKFPRAEVLECGDRDTIVARMRELCPGAAVIFSTATAGEHGTATTGDCGTATAGDGGIIVIRCFAGKRYRLVVGYIGETLDADGQALAPGAAYRVKGAGEFVRVSK